MGFHLGWWDLRIARCSPVERNGVSERMTITGELHFASRLPPASGVHYAERIAYELADRRRCFRFVGRRCKRVLANRQCAILKRAGSANLQQFTINQTCSANTATSNFE